MSLGVENLWLIPLLPLLAAALLALTNNRALAGLLSIGAMGAALIFSLAAFARTVAVPGRQSWNFDWLEFGSARLQLGFLLDPLTAAMLVMVTLVALLIFIFSTGYMAHDRNYAKFFCFLSLFAAGMLGVVIANSLLLLFFCWEIVGLASYLLIGFWFSKPSAAAAAQKAFLTTRIGDLGLFLGMIWLYSETGTLLFYDEGKGVLEYGALSILVTQSTFLGVGAATAIALLIFCGAAGKSGQVPLHVWLPDAMEGPTPVSALIHAATMVAAGVFLVARVYPLMDADLANIPGYSTALTVVTWTGAITAVFASLIAVAQNDIKRILAYSTVAQLGYMMAGLGMGGVFVGMFHLLTHAFFKALLFLGAGSVIHACHEEQDIRRMGGLRAVLPVTFPTYAAGMIALAGVVPMAGFWSKDEILHAAAGWDHSFLAKGPFLLLLAGAFLTAFYMTRQMAYVFFGRSRLAHPAHESPRVMTVPLQILAVCACGLGLLSTPAWPWLHAYLEHQPLHGSIAALFKPGFLGLALLSTAVVGAGLWAGWAMYLRPSPGTDLGLADPLERRVPELFGLLRDRFWVDEAYQATFLRLHQWLSRSACLLESAFFASVSRALAVVTAGVGWICRLVDNFLIDLGFDRACCGMREAAEAGRAVQSGNIQNYLRTIALAVLVLFLVLVWGWRAG